MDWAAYNLDDGLFNQKQIATTKEALYLAIKEKADIVGIDVSNLIDTSLSQLLISWKTNYQSKIDDIIPYFYDESWTLYTVASLLAEMGESRELVKQLSDAEWANQQYRILNKLIRLKGTTNIRKKRTRIYLNTPSTYAAVLSGYAATTISYTNYTGTQPTLGCTIRANMGSSTVYGALGSEFIDTTSVNVSTFPVDLTYNIRLFYYINSTLISTSSWYPYTKEIGETEELITIEDFDHTDTNGLWYFWRSGGTYQSTQKDIIWHSDLSIPTFDPPTIIEDGYYAIYLYPSDPKSRVHKIDYQLILT